MLGCEFTKKQQISLETRNLRRFGHSFMNIQIAVCRRANGGTDISF